MDKYVFVFQVNAQFPSRKCYIIAAETFAEKKIQKLQKFLPKHKYVNVNVTVPIGFQCFLML